MSVRVIPPFLKPGDKIAIAATARKVSYEEMKPAIEVFNNWGLEVITHPDLYKQYNQFAGTDECRAAVFQSYLDNEGVKAIVCARGGYGSVRMIDLLDWSSFNKQPKWVIGYSDVTVLHSHIHKHTNVCSLHATMPINMRQPEANVLSISAMHKVLFGQDHSTSISPHSLNRSGTAKGELIGGNLSVLFSLLGSNSDIDTKGKILFLEDLDEYLYHIDRMMQALKRAGKLTHLAGLIVGGMTDMKDNTIPFGKTAEEIIRETVNEFNYPICFNYPSGHQDINLPLVFGKQYQLSFSHNKFELAVLSKSV